MSYNFCFKATVRSGGSVSERIYNRQSDVQSSTSTCGESSSRSPAPTMNENLCGGLETETEMPFDIPEVALPHLDPTTSGPTLHEIKQKSSVESWSKIRTEMRQAVIECNGMPVNQLCIDCHQNEATYRCVQCSAWTYYCAECFDKAHSSKNLFHTGEVWQVS